MAMLPLLMLGGAAVVVVPQVNKAFEDFKKPSNSETMTDQQKQTMDEVGVLASPFYVLSNKQYLQGAGATGSVAGYSRDLGVRPTDPDPLAELKNQHLGLFERDRQDAQFALYASQGTLRPYRRVPIATTLTDELHHPKDPSRTTQFMASTYVPGNPSAAQIQAAQQVAASDDPERSLRRMQGLDMYNRAPFQSFRYSDD